MGGVHHLVSRGVELAYQQAGKHEKLEIEIPTWAPFLVAMTVASHLFIYLAVSYAFGILVPILTMVESPSATAVVRSVQPYTDDESPDAPLLSKEEKESQKSRFDEEVLIVAHKPITSKLRTVMRHLREQTGSRRAHWRGFGGFIVYNIATFWAVGFARAIIPFRLCSHLVHIPVAGALCLLSTAWVQQMIAMPGKNYFQRVSELAKSGAFCKLVLSVMAVEIVETAAFMLPHQLAILFSITENEKVNVTMVSIGAVLAVFTLLFSIFFVVIPLNIGLIRLQASLLHEDTATVVPMDRTLGEAEVKNIKTAWKSFSREGCRLLAKNYLKYIMIQVFLSMIFVMTLAAQAYLIFGDDATKIVREQAKQASMALRKM